MLTTHQKLKQGFTQKLLEYWKIIGYIGINLWPKPNWKKIILNSLERKEKIAHFNKCFIQTAATLFSPFCALLNFKDLRRNPHILTRNLSILPLASSFNSVANFGFSREFLAKFLIYYPLLFDSSKRMQQHSTLQAF